MVATAIYVAAAAAFSISPVQHAIAEAKATPSAPPPRVATSGPIPDEPDTGPMKIAKAVGKQAAIVFGPPALVLWFGWDVWFAVTGFFPGRRRPAQD